MKILIIEDEALLAGSIQTLLERRGFEAEAVCDGGADCPPSSLYQKKY